jgi:hypothetical protein
MAVRTAKKCLTPHLIGELGINTERAQSRRQRANHGFRGWHGFGIQGKDRPDRRVTKPRFLQTGTKDAKALTAEDAEYEVQILDVKERRVQNGSVFVFLRGS